MDEITLTQKFINLFLLMGVMFGFFYGLMYVAYKKGDTILINLLPRLWLRPAPGRFEGARES